jgi:mannose-1-phosphate guanylyltransferase
MKLILRILCCGVGSRLWPVSREMHSKPFIRLADGQSLLQKTCRRDAVLPLVTEMLTVTNRIFPFNTEVGNGKVLGLIGKANRYIQETFECNAAESIEQIYASLQFKNA